jgi:hypothetical protein
MTIEVILISKDSIFLPTYSGVRPIMSPAMNTAEYHLAEFDQPQGYEASERRKGVVHRIDSTAGCRRHRRRSSAAHPLTNAIVKRNSSANPPNSNHSMNHLSTAFAGGAATRCLLDNSGSDAKAGKRIESRA